MFRYFFATVFTAAAVLIMFMAMTLSVAVEQTITFTLGTTALLLAFMAGSALSVKEGRVKIEASI